MITSLITVALLCAFNTATTNAQYPSYQYAAVASSDIVVPVPYVIDSELNYFQSEARVSFTANLYFNDSTSFVLRDYQFDWYWDINKWDTEEEEWTYTDSFYGSYLYTGVSYTNETFDSFNFDLTFLQSRTNRLPTFTISNGGDEIYSYTPEEASYYPIEDNEFTYTLTGYLLYSQIQNFIAQTLGYQTGFNAGVGAGNSEGYATGYNDGVGVGYQDGYTTGFNDANNQDATAAVIFTGILEVALLPINVFLAIFNYEVFGINISGLVSALLTVAVVVIIIRVILSKSGGNGGSK